jgi:glycosyltransferase 2 family protein
MTPDSQSQPSPDPSASSQEPTPGAGFPAPDAGEPAPAPSQSSRGVFWRVLGTVLSLALLVYVIRAQGWDKFIEALKGLPPYYFWIALGLTVCSRICVGLRWYTLLRSAGVKMSFWQAQRLTFMGLFAANFLPTTVGGDLVRMAGTIYLGVDTGVGAASLVVDRLVGMTGMASLAPFGMAIVLRSGAGGTTSAAGSSIRLALLPFLARIPGVNWLYSKVEKFVRSLLHSAMYWLRHPWSLGWALLCTYGHMLFTFLSMWVLLQGMHQPLSFWWIGALWSLNYFFTTLVPVSINGLGLAEVAISYLYSHFGGVSLEAGLALAVFSRMLQFLASLPGAAFLPDILRPFPKRQKKIDVEQEASE